MLKNYPNHSIHAKIILKIMGPIYRTQIMYVCFSGAAAVMLSWVLWELIFLLNSCLMRCSNVRQVFNL